MNASVDQDIAKALVLLRRSPALDEYEIYRVLVREGMEPRCAARLVEFLPLVYGRIALAALGANFSKTFRRYLPDGRFSDPRSFSSEPVWKAVEAFARTEVEHGIAQEDLLAVASRSSEFISVNKIFRAGDTVEGALFEPVFFLWAEDGPDDGGPQRSPD